jgi:hypothetical protein
VKRLLAVGMLLLTTAPTVARADLVWPFSSLFRETAPSAGLAGGDLPPMRVWTKPHPAVVRVIVPERGGATSYGSGTLVDVHDRYGLVVTNYHVVSDASGAATVLFPDGFQTAAQVVKVDRNWDLAALAIWKPDVEPVAVASQPAHPGEWLSIAGYGQGPYRMAAGQCTQYLAPAMKLPRETVEVSVAARQGDSGGPILNARGELAGVLWGAGGGRTEGSYCGRVRQFLASVVPNLPAQRDSGAVALASTAPAGAGSAPRSFPLAESALPAYASKFSNDAASLASSPSATNRLPLPSTFAQPAASIAAGAEQDASGAAVSASPADILSFDWQDLAGNTRLDQAKTLLAAVGIIALALHFRKLII